MATFIGTWIAAGLTLMILSFLYKDNPFFRFAEHLYVGISNAYVVWLVWATIVLPDFIGRVFMNLEPGRPWSPDYWYLVPGILGLVMLTRMIPTIEWMSRWALAFVVGWGAGFVIGPTLNSYLLAQLYASFPWVNMQGYLGSPTGEYVPALINAILLFVCVVTVLIYFFFSYEHKGVIGGAAKIGIWVLMVAFGASFGSTVMARISLFIGRSRFLVQDAEPAGHAFSILLTIGILIVIIAAIIARRRQPPAAEDSEAAE
ncbi:MAG: hypothetical protein A2Y63_05385 [Candidatus Riflebacteria bacterium RBG_13_59_9]|nr:MAG: hypothetical protein A2Y63_05385 [Candidatus Riflebacteria bacterium RBG_13_59_9]